MNEAQTMKRPLGTRWCNIGITSGIIGLAVIVVGLLAARLGLAGPLTAFSLFGIGLLVLLICIVATALGLAMSKGTAGAASAGRTWTALLGSLAILGLGYLAMPESNGAPPIHDLTTDTANPPQFDALVAIRAADDAQNPPEYAGAETAKAQQAAFPDLATLTLPEPPADAFARAAQTAEAMGWDIVAADSARGIIEATDTTSWFRFKDDVVIRVSPGAGGSAVDVRSKSRVGMGDMGTNARRIRAYLDRLQSDS